MSDHKKRVELAINGYIKRHTKDISKLKNDTGWKPQTSLEAGLKKTVEWYAKASQ